MLRRFLIVALILAFGFLGALQVPRLGGRYMLQESDHTDVMMSGRTAQTQRTIRIVFVGNSFTFTNDLPAMVVNIAASDAGNTTELAVKAFTREDAHLGDLLLHSDALAWIRANPVDYVVLQDHSGWYSIPEWTEQAHRDAHAWRDALQPLNAKPVLFELWADSEGSDLYASPNYYAYGGNFRKETSDSERGSNALAQELGIPVVRVARSFYDAVQSGQASALYQEDLHHPSRAGTYLVALTFYRFFTGRSGAEATYRPWGVSAADAAALVKASAP